MSEFAIEMAGRVARTTESLGAARAADDDYLVAVLYGELESLARVADEHDIVVPGLAESLSRDGSVVDVDGVDDDGVDDDAPRVIDLGLVQDDTQRIA